MEIRWKCAENLIKPDSSVVAETTFKFPNGLMDYLSSVLKDKPTITPSAFHGQIKLPENAGRIEFAISWPLYDDGFCHSYCNTVPTPMGGTHETGLRMALSKGLRAYGEMVGQKKTSIITADDIVSGAAILLSVFIKEPQFQGQTKEKLANNEVARWVEIAVKDHFDHWLSSDPASGAKLLESIIEKAEERQRKKMTAHIPESQLHKNSGFRANSQIAAVVMPQIQSCS